VVDYRRSELLLEFAFCDAGEFGVNIRAKFTGVQVDRCDSKACYATDVSAGVHVEVGKEGRSQTARVQPS
jgi:hypothetical protein